MTNRKNRQRALRAYKRVEPVMLPLLELFADVDEVFMQEDAFAPENIQKSLGRCYRQWLKTRAALDPEFDPKRYRHDMKEAFKQHKRSSKPLSALASETGKEKRPVSDRPRSSTARKSISEKSQKQNAKPEKKRAKSSAKSVRSAGRASRGR